VKVQRGDGFFPSFLFAVDIYPTPLSIILRYNHIVVEGQADFDPNNPPFTYEEDRAISNAWILTWSATYTQPTPAFCESIKTNAINWANDRRTMVRLDKTYLRSNDDGSLELMSGPFIIQGTSMIITNSTTNVVFSKGQELWVDNDTGLVLSTLDHASPKKTKAEKDSAKKIQYDKIKAFKNATTDKQKLDALVELHKN
jgi:hypothetical protein